MFSLGGISSYGIREIARCKEDRQELNKVFSSLFSLHFITTVIAIVLLIVSIYVIPKFHEYQKFLWWGVTKLFFSLFLVEWLYQGLEQFKYITIRSVIIRLIFVICVFIFVKKASDVLIYFSLTCLTTILNSFVNWKYSFKFVNFSAKTISFKLILFPVISYGVYNILTSMYTTFNTVFLGFITDTTQVGYFSTASKLNSLIMNGFTAFTTVMIPHVSAILKNNNLQELNLICNKTLKVLFAIALPIILYCLIFAKDIVYIISGPGYEGAILPFRIIISLILIIGLEQIFVQQFLMASRQSNKSIIVISSVGAVIGLTMNLLLTPKYAAVGTSISWVSVEVILLILGFVMAKRMFQMNIYYNKILLVGVKSLLYIIPLWAIYDNIENMWLRVMVGLSCVGLVFMLINHKFVRMSLNKKI